MRWRALIVAVPLVALAACAPSPAGSTTDTGATDTATETATASSEAPATLGPQIPADTTVASPVDPAQMPTVKGAFGEKPTITVPSTPPPGTLQRLVLSKGSGAPVASGDWVQVNYLGQVWGGKVFDNSFDRGTLFTFQDGAAQAQVVAGWDVGLRGATEGSRVMLSFPPQDGYGPAGQAPDIKGTDTLVFVVDVVHVIPPTTTLTADATPQTQPTDIPKVSGALTGQPTIVIPPEMPEPTTARAVTIAKGTGAPAQAGNVLVQYAVTSWDGSVTESSWPTEVEASSSDPTGLQELPLDASSDFASLIGIPIGSRVFLETPADSSSGQPSLAWVFDLVVQADVTPPSTGTPSDSAAPTS